MAAQTTTSSESATMTKSVDERLLEEVAKPVEASALPDTKEKEEVNPRKETLKEHETPKDVENKTITAQEIPDEISKVAEIGTYKEQEIPKISEQESLPTEGTPEVIEKLSLENRETLEPTDKETPKEKETPEDNAPAEVEDENVKQVVEEEIPAKQELKEVKIAEVRDIEVPAVDQTSGAKRENKTEEVHTTVVHQVQNGAKPSQSRPSNIFHNVGSKMVQSVQKMKNAIIGKPSK